MTTIWKMKIWCVAVVSLLVIGCSHGKPPVDRLEAMESILAAASEGDARAQCDVGEILRVTVRNSAKAAKWYRLAADQGYGPAQIQLGNLYLGGQGVLQDDTKALGLFIEAASLGFVRGQHLLGYMHYYGRAVEQDYIQAAFWFEKAAELGDPLACVAYGQLFADGNGVEQNDETALKWFRKSAELGSHNGLHAVAAMYRQGRGVAENKEYAIELYEEAAARGNLNSIRELSEHYLRNHDFDRAIRHARAATRADPDHSRSYYVLARGLQKTGAEKASIDAYHAAIALDSPHPIWLNNLAWLLIAAKDERLRDPAEGLELARRAVDESETSDAALRSTLVEALIVNDETQEARSVLIEALRLHPEDEYLLEQKERLEAEAR